MFYFLGWQTSGILRQNTPISIHTKTVCHKIKDKIFLLIIFMGYVLLKALPTNVLLLYTYLRPLNNFIFVLYIVLVYTTTLNY